jgi:hypothetical protein
MCRVSTQITGSSTAINPLTSHWIADQRRSDPVEGHTKRGQNGDDIGRLGRRGSKTTLQASSITHTDAAFTDTFRPAKWTMLSRLPRGRGLQTSIHYPQRKGTRTHHRCVPRPPRYIICRFSHRQATRQRARRANSGLSLSCPGRGRSGPSVPPLSCRRWKPVVRGFRIGFLAPTRAGPGRKVASCYPDPRVAS